MPTPTPAYHPQLAARDVVALERLVRRPTSEQRLVQRAKLALLLHAQPALGNTAAAQQLGQHPNWVRKWRKRWALAGFALPALADRPRSGRPRSVSPPGGGDGQSRGL
jgi:Winged helix-turn helix